MKLTFITENSSVDHRIKAEYGMSVYIEDGDIRMLFDVGEYGQIRENSRLLGIDLTKVNVIAFSHNHVDHCGGMLKIYDLIDADCRIYAHRGFSVRKWWDHRLDNETDPTYSHDLEMVGPAFDPEFFFTHGLYHFRLIDDDLYKVSDNIFLIGNFPQARGMEAIFPGSKMQMPGGELVTDEFRDEQACVVKVREGIVVLTGCAHNGIVNILNTVKKHFPDEKIIGVYGGTHLVDYNIPRVNRTIDYFNESGIEYVGVCHCTGPALKDFVLNAKNYVKVGAGYTIEIE